MRRLDYSWIILATGFTILFFGGGSMFITGLMLKPMTEDLEWSRSSISLALTMFMMVSALAMPVVGRLADRYDLRWVIGAGVAAAGCGVGLMAGITALWQVFLLYGLFALGHAGSSVPTVGVMITRWFESRRGIANSAAMAGLAVGQLVIIIVLASFLSSIGWRTSYAALGAANVFIVLPLVLRFVRARPPAGPEKTPVQPVGAVQARLPHSTESSSSILPIFASRQLWLLVGIYFICGFQDFFVSTHVVAFATDQGIGELLAGNMLGLMGLMGLAGVLVSGLLSDAYGPTRPTALCFLVRIAIFAYIIFFQNTPSILVFALLYGSTYLITAPLLLVFAGNVFGPARLGAVSGILSMTHQMAGGLGAFIGALIFEYRDSYDGAFVLALVLALLATAATAMVREQRPVRLLAEA